MATSFRTRRRLSSESQSPEQRIDAAQPDAKSLGLRSVHRDVGGNIIGGTDTLTNTAVTSRAPSGLDQINQPSEDFRAAFPGSAATQGAVGMRPAPFAAVEPGQPGQAVAMRGGPGGQSGLSGQGTEETGPTPPPSSAELSQGRMDKLREDQAARAAAGGAEIQRRVAAVKLQQAARALPTASTMVTNDGGGRTIMSKYGAGTNDASVGIARADGSMVRDGAGSPNSGWTPGANGTDRAIFPSSVNKSQVMQSMPAVDNNQPIKRRGGLTSPV